MQGHQNAVRAERRPATCQRVTDVKQGSVRWPSTTAYLTDKVVFLKWAQDHIEYGRRALGYCIKQALASSKEVQFFGRDHRVFWSRYLASQPWARATYHRRCGENWAFLYPEGALLSLGFVQHLWNVSSKLQAARRFLHKKLGKNQHRQQDSVGKKKNAAVASLKNALISRLDFGVPRSTGQFTLDAAAIDNIIGCVLFQK